MTRPRCRSRRPRRRPLRPSCAAAGIEPDRHRSSCVHVSAGNPFRRWPAASFVGLIARSSAAWPDRRVVVMSGPSEHEAARLIGGAGAGRARRPGRRRDRRRRFRSRRTAGADGPRRRCSSAATADRCTSPARRGVPIVGLYGPTLAARSAPWRPARFVTESVEVARPHVPPVRPAALRAGRLPVPRVDRAGAGGRGRRARAGGVLGECPYGDRTDRRNAAAPWLDWLTADRAARSSPGRFSSRSSSARSSWWSRSRAWAVSLAITASAPRRRRGSGRCWPTPA